MLGLNQSLFTGTCVDEVNRVISHTKHKYSTDSTELNMR